MKRKIWRAFCSYYAQRPFEKDDEVIVFFEAADREEARETLPVLMSLLWHIPPEKVDCYNLEDEDEIRDNSGSLTAPRDWPLFEIGWSRNKPLYSSDLPLLLLPPHQQTRLWEAFVACQEGTRMSKRKRSQPPHSVEAEQSVLGGLMLDNDRWDDVATQISAQDFFISAHRTIFSHMQTLIEQGNPIDLITLSESLEQQERLEQVGGFAYLAELSKNTPSAANIIPYAQYIASYGELRQLLLLGNELRDMAGQPRNNVADVLAFAEQKLFTIAQSHQDGGLTDISACFDSVLAGIAQRYEAERGSLSGTPSGL
ncbi:replicative DNA helicase [Salmonella enterica subsp. arizonae]|uniref:DNA 5'-3' helicase n=2 Tax=Salmonella enterica TaxID=28901 RepID=A0A447RA91_SALER|nr:replicative DNA helicase [Salmonella enterica subsp. arizonae]